MDKRRRPRNTTLLNALAILGGAGVCVVAGAALMRTVSADPLSRFKKGGLEPEAPGVEMTDFDWKAYKGQTLLAEAHVARAEVGKNRDIVNLTTVSGGKLYVEKKLAFGFEASNAVYYSAHSSLEGRGRARVFNDTLDLSSAEFRYDPAKRALVVPTKLIGKLQGGDLKAESLTYKLEDKSVTARGVRWSGMVAQDNTRRKWSFTNQEGHPNPNVTLRGPITTYTKLKATDGEVIVLADGAEYNRDTDVLTAKGHVKYYGSDANLSCEQVVVYRKEKRAVLTGAVDMLIKPKQGGKAEEVAIPPVTPVVPEQIAKDRPVAPPPDTPVNEQEKQLRTGKNIRDYPIVMTAQRIEYWYAKGQKRAVISGSPQARQELPDGSWRMVWADRGNYDGEKETLELKSSGGKPEVRMLNSLGDDLRAESVLVSTKENDDMMDAVGVTMDVSIDDSEGPERTKGDGEKKEPPPPISGPIGKKGRG